MKTLKTLTIAKFLGIDEATLSLTKPVLLVVGDNGVGKSSVLNALEFALRGTCRELPKKKDSVKLARDGDTKGCKVQVEWADGMKWARTVNSCTVSESLIAGSFGDPERVRMVFRPERFLEAPPAERAEIVATLACDRTKLRAEAVRLFAEAGLDPAAAESMADRAAEDLDKAESLAVENRREAKRGQKVEIPAPVSKVEIEGPDGECLEYDVADTPVEDINKRLEEREAERKKLSDQRDKLLRESGYGELKIGGGADEVQARIEGVESELFKLGTPIDPASLERLRSAKLKADSEVSDLEKLVAELRGRHAQAKTAYSQAEKLKEVCPTCRRKMGATELAALLADMASQGDKIIADGKKAAADLEDAKVAAAKAEALFQEADQVRSRWNELNITLEGERALLAKSEKFAEIEAAVGKASDELSKVERALRVGRELLAARRRYDAELSKKKQAEAELADAGRMAEVWDRVAKFLAGGGPLREIASQGFDMNMVENAAGYLLPGSDVTVDKDWGVYLDGRPAELLSASEKWRLAACFAAALAHASGLGLLVLDGAEILDVERREALMFWLENIREIFGTIIVGATTDARPVTDWLACWEVEGNTVREVAQQEVTTA